MLTQKHSKWLGLLGIGIAGLEIATCYFQYSFLKGYQVALILLMITSLVTLLIILFGPGWHFTLTQKSINRIISFYMLFFI